MRSEPIRFTEKGLSLKSVRNVIDATFRAMFRDARTEYLPELEEKTPLPLYKGPV